MSEKKIITVTVQLKKEKRVIRFAYQVGLPFFAILTEKLTKEGISFSLCSGKGICGKCRVRFLSGAPMPEPAERNYLTAEELRQGIRLACMTRPAKDCEVEVLFEQETTVVTEFWGDARILGKRADSVGDGAFTDRKIVSGFTAAQTEQIIVADVGTTTIAMALTDKTTGKVIDTYTCLNPQSVYGADVIARITAAGELGAEKLQEAVWKALETGAEKLQANEEHFADETESIPTIYVAANTVMSHFLAGSDASGLGSAPFTPEFLEQREVLFSNGNRLEDTEEGKTRVVLLPGISAFVGGDITAGLLSCGMLPDIDANRGVLFLDLGTNGEMALCNGEKIYCTAAAAGPAFEGKAGERRGSHMIHSLAKLLRTGAMDKTGLLLAAAGETQSITQKEIRDLQMAKAAVRTGIEVLLQRAGLKETEVEKVWLAGGFGYYIEVTDAIEIGLLPESFRGKTVSVGNASLQGAVVYAGMEKEQAEQLEVVLRKKCVPVNLAEEDYFIEHYVERMEFPISFDGEK